MSCCSKPQKQQRKKPRFRSVFLPLFILRRDSIFLVVKITFHGASLLTLKVFTQTLETTDEKSSKPVEKFCHTQSSSFPNQDFHFSQKIIFQQNLREISRFSFVFHEFLAQFSKYSQEKFNFLSQIYNFQIFLTLQLIFSCLMFCYVRSERSEFRDRLWMTDVEISAQNLGTFLCVRRERPERRDVCGLFMLFSRQTVKDDASVRAVCCLVAEFMQKVYYSGLCALTGPALVFVGA